MRLVYMTLQSYIHILNLPVYTSYKLRALRIDLPFTFYSVINKVRLRTGLFDIKYTSEDGGRTGDKEGMYGSSI